MDERLIWFETLYDTHADALWRYFFHRLGDRERSKELMQEVFMKTWQYIVLGKTITHERAFLYQIAKNTFINEIRSRKTPASLETLEDAGHEFEDTTDITQHYPEHTELHDRLQGLRDSYREVLILRYIEDLPVKEIASILGETETNISMRIKRGIDALKKTYEVHNTHEI